MNQNLKPLNFQLGLLEITAAISLDPVISRGANVVGEIRSRNRQFRDEYVLIVHILTILDLVPRIWF